VNGETLTLQIYGFNRDVLADGSGNKTNITFGLKNLMSEIKVVATNTVGGWSSSTMRSWLNTDLFNNMQTDVSNKIKNVNKLSSGGYHEQVIKTISDKIFLFSEVELFGSNENSLAGEGFKYPLFSNNSSRIKKLSNGSGTPYHYWTRSPLPSTVPYYMNASDVGNSQVYSSDMRRGVCFGFAIGNAPTNTYTVTYNSNGGTAVASTTATLNTTISAPTAPTKANAIFDGWYKDAGLVSKWAFASDKVTGATTLYAKWKTLPPIGNSLSSYTWEEIALVAEFGLGDDYWNVGDTKNLTLSSGETITMQIYGFDHDNLHSSVGKANITFGALSPGTLKGVMNTTNTNAGGWGASYMRSYLNTSFMNLLPSDVKPHIKTVKKEFSPKTESWFGDWYPAGIRISPDKVFLLSEKELMGHANPYKFDEGTKYSIFSISGRSRGNSLYWLRSQVDDRGGLRVNPQNTVNGFLYVSETWINADYTWHQTHANVEHSIVFLFCF